MVRLCFDFYALARTRDSIRKASFTSIQLEKMTAALAGKLGEYSDANTGVRAPLPITRKVGSPATLVQDELCRVLNGLQEIVALSYPKKARNVLLL